MRLFGFEITRKKPKNMIIDTSSYVGNDFWSDISNASNTDKGMKLAAVFRCIDVLSDNISMLPWASVDTKTHEKPSDDHAKQVHYLLNVKPNRSMTPAVFFKTLEQHRLNGNAYAEIVVTKNGFPVELKIIQPNRVQIKEQADGEITYEVQDKYGKTRSLLSHEILHFKNISSDGLVGKSVLSFASDCIANMTYQERYNKSFYKEGGRPSGILSTSADLGAVSVKKDPSDKHGKSLRDFFRKDFERHVGGIENAGRVAVLDNGLTYTPIQPISQKDMDFVESKNVCIADICRFYGVPLYLVFSGKESYQSNEANNIAFVTGKLNPIVTGYEQELSSKLYAIERLKSGVSIKANLRVLLRGDTQARAIYYEKMVNMGAMSVNDVRDKEDMGAIEGGDVYRVSRNYMPLDEFREQSRTQSNRDKSAIQDNKIEESEDNQK